MEYKNIRLIIVVVIAFTILAIGYSISTTRVYYNVKPKKSESTINVLKLGSQTYKQNDGQR